MSNRTSRGLVTGWCVLREANGESADPHGRIFGCDTRQTLEVASIRVLVLKLEVDVERVGSVLLQRQACTRGARIQRCAICSGTREGHILAEIRPVRKCVQNAVLLTHVWWVGRTLQWLFITVRSSCKKFIKTSIKAFNRCIHAQSNQVSTA